MTDKHVGDDPIIIGWREWVSLPELGIEKIKIKADTGARTSALHTFRLSTFEEDGKLKVEFDIHPLQKNTDKIVTCIADVVDYRWVMDSGGHREQRYVIKTPITLRNNIHWPIEITLTNRDNMRFRMLLGRSALRDKSIAVDPGHSFKIRKPKNYTLINP